MNGDRGFLHSSAFGRCLSFCWGSEGSSPVGHVFVATDLYAVGSFDPDHDAVMRISGEAPGGGPFFRSASSAMFEYGFPPPRIVNFGSPPKSQREHRAGKRMLFPGLQPAGRRMTPSNVSPVVTKRQSAMTSLRARATIMVLRVPIRLSAVRAWYHRASALSF